MIDTIIISEAPEGVGDRGASEGDGSRETELANIRVHPSHRSESPIRVIDPSHRSESPKEGSGKPWGAQGGQQEQVGGAQDAGEGHGACVRRAGPPAHFRARRISQEGPSGVLVEQAHRCFLRVGHLACVRF